MLFIAVDDIGGIHAVISAALLNFARVADHQGRGSMFDFAIAWMLNNPLQGVALLAGFSIVVGVVLVPKLHELSDHGHPRC